MLIKIKRRILRSVIMVIGCSRYQLERRYSAFAVGLMRWQAAEKPANRACIIFAHGRESDRILGFLLELV